MFSWNKINRQDGPKCNLSISTIINLSVQRPMKVPLIMLIASTNTVVMSYGDSFDHYHCKFNDFSHQFVLEYIKKSC